MNDGPLIVQSDKTLLLEIDHERAQDCRKAIAPFAELERSPEHIHTYRLTPLGLWNARAAGHDAEQVVDTLLEYSRYAVPHDFPFPLEEGRTMPEEVAAITDALNAGTLTYRDVADSREGERSLSMVWLMVVRNGGDRTGLATPSQIADLVHEGPRCGRDCRPVPGRP